jgi:hypothetical protein
MTPDAALAPHAQEQLSLAIGTTPGKVSEKRRHLQFYETFSPEPVHTSALVLGTHHFYLLLEAVR